MTTTMECTPNIGPHERARRILIGVSSLTVGVLLGALLIALSIARPWRVLIFAPVWVGALGIFQAQEKTCVALVARGQRNMDAGVETVSDPVVLEQLKRQARKVYLRSLLVAAVVTAAAVAAP